MIPAKGHWLRAAFTSSRFLSSLAELVLNLGRENSCRASQGPLGAQLFGRCACFCRRAWPYRWQAIFTRLDSHTNSHNIAKNTNLKSLFKHLSQIRIGPCLVFPMSYHVLRQLGTVEVTDRAPGADSNLLNEVKGRTSFDAQCVEMASEVSWPLHHTVVELVEAYVNSILLYKMSRLLAVLCYWGTYTCPLWRDITNINKYNARQKYQGDQNRVPTFRVLNSESEKR